MSGSSEVGCDGRKDGSMTKSEMLNVLSDDDLWDQHAIKCGNCAVEMIIRKGVALSDDGGGEDEHLCGACAGAQMYIYMEQLEAEGAKVAAKDKALRIALAGLTDLSNGYGWKDPLNRMPDWRYRAKGALAALQAPEVKA